MSPFRWSRASKRHRLATRRGSPSRQSLLHLHQKWNCWSTPTTSCQSRRPLLQHRKERKLLETLDEASPRVRSDFSLISSTRDLVPRQDGVLVRFDLFHQKAAEAGRVKVHFLRSRRTQTVPFFDGNDQRRKTEPGKLAMNGWPF